MKKSRAKISVCGKILQIPLEKIRVYKRQPRTYFGEKEMADLVASIKEDGQQVPAIVRRLPKPDAEGRLFELIGGQRRYYACARLKIPTLKAEVRKVKSEKEQFSISLTENVNRASMTSMEIARAVERLEDEGMTQEQIGKKCGCSGGNISQYRSLLYLPPQVQKLLDPEIEEDKRITFSTALLIGRIPRNDLQIKIARIISQNNMSHARAKYLIEKTLGKRCIVPENRRPEKDYASIMSFLARNKVYLELLMMNKGARLKSAFEERSIGEKNKLRVGFAKLGVELSEVLEFMKKNGLI